MRNPLLLQVILLALLLVASGDSRAVVLATELLPTPLAPAAPRSRIQLAVANLDPVKPVWVSYKLVAASASDKATGEVVLDASFEGVPIKLPDSKVAFPTSKLERSSPGSGMAQQLHANVGDRPRAELESVYGHDLTAVYEALKAERGSVFQGTVVKVYSPVQRQEAVLLASIDRASDIQPLLLSIAIGQGDIPSELSDSGSSSSDLLVKRIILFVGASIAAIVWWRRRR